MNRSCATSLPLVLVTLLGTLAPVEARAQWPDRTWQPPEWVGDVTFLSANALLGGLTAGILQEVRGGSFKEGFAIGAAGGALSYGGRRLAGQDFWGAGLLGRQVSAVGASAVRNASEGRPAFSRLLLAAGPVILNVHRDSAVTVRAKVDLYAMAWLVSSAFDERLDLDWSASISAGAPVFSAPLHRPQNEDGPLLGQMAGGLILLGRGAEGVPDTDVLAHERIHVLQYDFGREIWGSPLENWLARMIPGGATVVRFVEPGITYGLIQASWERLFDIEWQDRPWEIEAEFLEHRQ